MRPERYRRLRRVLDRRQPDLTVLMDRVHKSHNFSAILRNCDAVGVLDVHAVPPEDGLDLHRDTAAGSDRWVRVHRHRGFDAAAGALRRHGFRLVAAHPAPDAVDYRTVDFTRPTAIVVGSELHGLSARALGGADEVAVIPMVGMVQSLNVSVATSLLLFEAFAQRRAAGFYDAPRLGAERYRDVLFEWAWPRLARLYREQGRPYPELDEEGQPVSPDTGDAHG